MINLRYDLTPLKYLSIIVCEIGAIPPHSVPVVISEIMNELENNDDVLFFDSESSESDDEEDSVREKNIEDTLGWNLVEGHDLNSSAGSDPKQSDGNQKMN